ncbi:TetR/AcrR family transcriptional regulator [Mycolicibacterium neoaurum]|uniref:TetR/AcrR family transcriptional regulator n=1 Tax=Mycolicibacterium neoaurum TaxID=1795 RepID=UPI002673A773|nr:TetR/AcrR family transcriptional regulator [Mycolicibacterium neoaurum]MDO3399292.1 TetR/AcrR family transcriptional regulator [Mycolicibacterium neoaurum]
MTTADRAAPPVARKRPRDRKAQIVKASAEAFSAFGYHAVSMEDIASRVGISAAALYRHFPGKYELLRDAVVVLGQQLVDGTEISDADADPETQLEDMVGALVDTAIANRSSGGLYRWEGRYLSDDDQAVLNSQIELVNRRLQQPLMQVRPQLTSRERWTLTSAALSVIGSVTDHRAALPLAEMRSLLKGLASAILWAELPAPAELIEPPRVLRSGAGTGGKYEILLHESLLLFHRMGFRETSMEDIAAATGMQPSGIYRFFPSKADILAASYRRSADRVSGDLSSVLAVQPDPERALIELVGLYVHRSFRNPELAYVYYAERGNVPEADRMVLRNIQRATVDEWARLLSEVRTEFSHAQARFAVHAAFGLMVDLGRLVHYEDTAHSRAVVRLLMELTLLGRGVS